MIDEEIVPRRIHIPHEAMEQINEKLEIYRNLGVPEHVIAEYRNELIKNHETQR